MEQLSERVSVDRQKGRLSVVISARTTKGKEAMLLTWFVAWLFIGGYVLYARTQLPTEDPVRQYLLAFLAFWIYFAVKVGRALLWRLKGFELWRVKDGTLTIKDSLFGYGRANPYFVDNIKGLGMLKLDPTSFKYQLSDSFWTVGGERLGFEHLGKKVAFGKGLNEEESKRLLLTLQDALKKARNQAIAQ